MWQFVWHVMAKSTNLEWNDVETLKKCESQSYCCRILISYYLLWIAMHSCIFFTLRKYVLMCRVCANQYIYFHMNTIEMKFVWKKEQIYSSLQIPNGTSNIIFSQECKVNTINKNLWFLLKNIEMSFLLQIQTTTIDCNNIHFRIIHFQSFGLPSTSAGFTSNK